MPFAIAALVFAGALLVAGWQNRPLLDVLLARDDSKIPGGSPSDFAAAVINADPTAVGGIGALPTVSPALPGFNQGTGWTAPAGGQHGFNGAHAGDLNALAAHAQAIGLTITATTNGVHVPGSYHYKGEAFDAAGPETVMHAFAASVPHAVTELIHNPGFAIKNGKLVNGPVVYAAVWLGHKNHVHVAWA